MNSRALEIQTTLIETAQYSIHRIESPEFGSVIVKASRSSQPSRKEIAQLENEFRILKSLEGVEGIPRVISLEVESHRAHLMLEDFGGLSLAQFTQNRPLRLDQFFDFAKQVVSIIGELHMRSIVHCDLKPANILINPQTLKVQIIDFGASRQLIGRGQFSADGQGLTLAYIAPEQTGRVNRRVDHRTDFYSLGISFYELLSGRLPFHGNDALEWVHAHIAKKARPLHELDHHITPALSQIVERLMNKAPEDRYQSPEGLLHDLGLAQKLFEDRKLWDSITLGERDRSTKLFLSQKIVGRERELFLLNEEYMKSQLEGLRYVRVHGEAGSGKSALAREFRRVYADQIALFGFGKADPRQSTFPFSTFATVVDDLVKQITNAPDSLKGEFITKLDMKLQSSLGALLVMAPSLKELVCVLEKVEDATDTMGRLYVTIAGFFETMVEVFGQVVVQIDDAHFIDEASAKSISWLLENEASLHVLFVLNYRESEVVKSAFIRDVFAGFQAHPEFGSEIALSDLKTNDVTEFLVDTLHESSEHLSSLAELLQSKSGGNPFFMGQVLKTWIDDQLLYNDPFKGWTWQKSAIESKAIAKSVLDLLGSKVQALPRNVRYLFTMASCFPKAFSAQDLTELTGVEEDGIRSATIYVIDSGLIVVESEGFYRFAHEQIREAFYSLLSPESRRDLHAHVGLKLLRAVNWNDVSNDELFITAENLNVGINKIRDPETRLRMVDLNLRVAQLAREGSAYELGLKFANAGIESGDTLDWSESSDRLGKLYALKGEFEYRTGDLSRAEATFSYMREASPSRAMKIEASLHLMRLLQSSGRTLDSMNAGLESLAMFGLKINRHPSSLRLGFGLLRAAFDLRGDEAKKIPILAGTSEETEFQRLRQELLVLTSTAAYFIDKRLLLSISLTGYRLAMKEGLSGDITNHFLFVGMVLAGKFGRYQQVERNCVNTIDRVREYIKPRAALLMRFNRQAFILPWLSSWAKSITNFEELREESIKAGEPITATIVSLYLPYYRMYVGYDIAETPETIEFRDYLAKNDTMLLDCALPGYGFRALLRGETENDKTLTHEGFNEVEYVARVSTATTPNPKAWFDAHKMMSLFMFGHYKEAITYFEGARRYLELSPFSLTIILIRAFGILVVTENVRAGAKITPFLKQRVRLARRQMKTWARYNKIDVEPYAFLMEAEVASMEDRQLLAMDLYERAAQAALKTKSWMIAGIIYERTARFNIFYKRERLARAHAEEAAYCFERWGATGKAAQVRRIYGLATSRKAISTDSRSSDSSRLSQQIDVESIMKSTRALSSELDLDVLSVKLTEVMMEASGASRAVLLLPFQDGFTVKSSTGELHDGYPSFVKEAAQNLESVSVGNTSESDLTKTDAYFAKRKGMSALAAPIVQQGTLLGLIYLENETATDIFTTAQLEVMRVLASQAAVALQNARLYSEVLEKARMSGELKTAQAVQKTLFPAPQLKLPDVEVTGFYQPASECGGDWWFYHDQGDKLFVYIGDATGHGAPAALVTSAARSAVSIMSLDEKLTPATAMSRLNRAIFETSKGSMNMTFFIASYDRKTGVLEYSNASHEPPFWIKKSVTESLTDKDDAEAFQGFKAGLGSLDEVHGPRLGESLASLYRQSQVTLASDDLILLFTDGVADARNSDRKEWGQRRFLKALQKATRASSDIDSIVQQVVADNKAFTGSVPLDDDIMIVAIKGHLAN